MRQGHPPAEAAKISLERIIQYYPKFEGAVGKKQNKKCGIVFIHSRLFLQFTISKCYHNIITCICMLFFSVAMSKDGMIGKLAHNFF